MWWRRAMADGWYEGNPQSDSTGAETELEFDAAIRAPGQRQSLGVLQALFSTERLSRMLGSEELAGRAYLQIVSADKTVLVSRNPTLLLQPLADQADIALTATAATSHITTAAGLRQLVAAMPTPDGPGCPRCREPDTEAVAGAGAAALLLA